MRRVILVGAVGATAGLAYLQAKRVGIAIDGLSVSRKKASRPCRPIVVCGPSGAGKSTLISRLQKEFPEDFGFSVSHTTRSPREGEVDGADYHFATLPAMQQAIARGEFIETAVVHGNLYGTSHHAVDDVSKGCRVCLVDIDVQGVQSCQRAKLDVAKYVLVEPPSIAELEVRLRKRGKDSDEVIALRVRNASKELEMTKSMKFDERVMNDDVDAAYARLRSAVEATRLECAAERRRQGVIHE